MVTKKRMDPMLKALILFSIIFAIVIFTVMVILLIPSGKRQSELKTLPEQTAQVEVVRLSYARVAGSRSCTVLFRFPDGTEKSFGVDSKIYDNIYKNETGTLTYKEIPNSENKGYDHRLFVKFEKNLDLSNEKDNVRARKIEYIYWISFSFVVFPISMFLLCFGGILVDKRKIRSSIKSYGGHVISIKKIKTGSIQRPIFQRSYDQYYAKYKIIYQIEDQKTECFADFEKIRINDFGRTREKVRLFDKTNIN